MKIYLCYKFTGIEKDVLLQELNGIKAVFDDFGFESFIFNLEYDDAEFDADFVAAKMKEQIAQADLILTYINYPQKSEGMLIEQGIAYSLGKKIAVFVKKEIKSNYFLTYGTNSDIIEYDDYSNFIQKLKEYLVMKLGRENIDKLDNEILTLLAKRFESVQKIGKYKKQAGLPTLDKTRREAVLEQKVNKAKQLGLDEVMIKNIWEEIHKQALIQEEML